jgi:hypothetical protein
MSISIPAVLAQDKSGRKSKTTPKISKDKKTKEEKPVTNSIK